MAHQTTLTGKARGRLATARLRTVYQLGKSTYERVMVPGQPADGDVEKPLDQAEDREAKQA